MNSSFNDFIEYCKSFYGYGGLYDQGRSREQIAYATCLYLDAIAHYDCDTYTWGDGDSLCLLYTSPSPRDWTISRMPSSA